VEEDFYSVDEAARILRLTPGRIRQMLRAGDPRDNKPVKPCPRHEVTVSGPARDRRRVDTPGVTGAGI
jgi:hypothetical protein